jgi:hypothetical protein
MRGIRGAKQTEARTVQSTQDGRAVACPGPTARSAFAHDLNRPRQLGVASAGRLP